MRNKYHIKINRDKAHQLETVARGFERPLHRLATTKHGSVLTDEYLVDLSKYELLYTRLTCHADSIIEMDEFYQHKQQDQQIA